MNSPAGTATICGQSLQSLMTSGLEVSGAGRLPALAP